MTADEIHAALALPAASRVEQRIPKKLLIEHSGSTASDKRKINEGIEALHWLAALKPSTTGIPAYRDAVREYLEIAVLHLVLRSDAKENRLVELVHRAVPYPVVLVADSANGASVSLAHKRWSEAEEGATVLEDRVVTVATEQIGGDDVADGFRAALAIGALSRTSLYATYDGWMDAIAALRAARINGTFSLPQSPQHAEARRMALAECLRLESEMASVRTAASKETQMASRVELNLALQRLRDQLVGAKQKL